MAASIDELRTVPLFSGMTDRALQSIADLASDFHVEAGSALTTEGEPGESFYLITDGRLEISRSGTPISTLGAGDFIGEISLLDGRPRTATAVTLGPVRGLVIQRAAFTELMDRFPPVRLGILMALTERIRRDERAPVA